MSRDTRFDGPTTTSEEFEEALGQLLLAATQNDVNLLGSWEFRTDDAAPDREVMVIELEKRVSG